MDVVLAFTEVQSRATSLDGMARSQMIVNQLKRLDVDAAAVLIRTKEISTKSRARVALYDQAGHLLINQGHAYHLLSKPDLYRYQVDLLAANQRLSSYNHYRGNVYLANFEADSPVSNRQKLIHFAYAHGLTPSYISIQVLNGYLNNYYQQQVNQGRRVDMIAMQQAYVDMIWPALVKSETLALGIYPRAPLVLLLQENDLTAYFLSALIDHIRNHGGRIVSPALAFPSPPANYWPINLHTQQGYLTALLGLELPRNLSPASVGGNQAWTNAYLMKHGFTLP